VGQGSWSILEGQRPRAYVTSAITDRDGMNL
jgi:hypothetical protein